MRWMSLSELVTEVQAVAPSAPVTDADLDRRAKELVTSGASGTRLVAALALRCMERQELIRIRPAAVRLVHETDLHSIPLEPLYLLRRPGVIIEVSRPESGERLWGDTVGLGIYHYGEQTVMVGHLWPDVVLGSMWTHEWDGREIDPLSVWSASRTYADPQTEWADQAGRFALMLGLLMDVKGAPVRIETEKPKKSPASHNKATSAARGWTVRQVYLTEQLRPSTAVDSMSSSPGASLKPGLVEESVQVRGHLKRQRHGPKMSLEKWIYVESHEARRWMAPHRYVTVH